MSCSSTPVLRLTLCLGLHTWAAGFSGHARAEDDGPSSLWLRRWHPIALAVGFVAGSRGDGFEPVVTISMHGVSPVADANAELAVGEPDENGNIALEMDVKRLPQLPQGGWYELYLSKNGVIGASCGTFVMSGDETTVRLSVGYDLRSLARSGPL